MAQIPIKNGYSPGTIQNLLRAFYPDIVIYGDIFYADTQLIGSEKLFLNKSELTFPDINCNNIHRVFGVTSTGRYGSYYTGAVYSYCSDTRFFKKTDIPTSLSRLSEIPDDVWAKQSDYYTGTQLIYGKGQFCGHNFIDITQKPPRLPIELGENIISVVECFVDGVSKYLNLSALYGLTWSVPNQIQTDTKLTTLEFSTYEEANAYYNSHTSSAPEALKTYLNFYRNYQDKATKFKCTTGPFGSIMWIGDNPIFPVDTEMLLSTNTKLPVAKPELTESNVENYYMFPDVGNSSGRKYIRSDTWYYDLYSKIMNCIYTPFINDSFEDKIILSENINFVDGVSVSTINPNSPYLPGGDYGSQSTPSDAAGSFDGTPGPSIVENLPVGSSGSDIASSGMYTKYLCNNALLNLLAEFFWEDNIGIQALKAVLGNPIDSIISLTAYPFALETLVPTTATTIYFGQYDSHFSAFSLTKSSFQIDWGTVTIPFFWGSFLDYSPYTKIQLYLPWGVGFVSIDPNEVVPWSSKNSYNKADFVNGTIRVVTNIELDKGACVHNIVGNNGRVIGSFGGVVGKQVPVTGSDNSARILAMISAAVSSSAAIGTSAGGTLAAGKNLAYGKGMSMAERAEGREMIGNYKSYVGNTVQSLSNALSSPPSYPRAGTFSDATNTLGYQYPYLIISRPSQSVPQQYGRFMGYPSNIFHAHLGEVRGYTEVSSIHLENINATANELDELESILKGGVLL